MPETPLNKDDLAWDIEASKALPNRRIAADARDHGDDPLAPLLVGAANY